MTTIESRLTALEQSFAKPLKHLPIPFGILPRVGDPGRAAAQADIDARSKGVKKFIVYEIV